MFGLQYQTDWNLEYSLFMQLVYHYCPHNVGHHLGLEVHDVHTLSDSEPLAPGAVITIEPGAIFMVTFTCSKVWRESYSTVLKD